MAAALFSIEPLLSAIEARCLILTANNRQRNQILRSFHLWAQQNYSEPWREPRVQTLRQWAEQQWQTLLLVSPEPLGSASDSWQQLLLWEEVISHSAVAESLLRPRQLAATAEQARATLANWRCPKSELTKHLAFADSASNLAVFHAWQEKFAQRLSNHNLLTQEQVYEHLIGAYRAQTLASETGALLYGFDDITPLAQALINAALPEATSINYSPRQNRLCLTSAATAEAEIRAAALWASSQLEADPSAVIGIIIPELGQKRTQVERIFTEVFEPCLNSPHRARYTPAFNFSAGTPLGHAPVIHSALALLALHQRELDIESLCNLLFSQFWGDSHSDSNARNAIAVRLRDLGKQQLSITDLRASAQKVADKLGEHSGKLHTMLEKTSGFSRQRHHRLTLGEWLDKLTELLSELGWPGRRRLDSVEYQQLKRWYELQEQLLSTEQIKASLSLSEVLDLLRQSAEKTHFQAQTPDSPIQILGALEGAGLHFSHCWVMGLHHRQWPASASPNPLLPVSLQREYAMPHASAERELLFAERLTRSFKQAAGQVVFSYPRGEGDQPLHPSTLIADLPYQALEQLLAQPQSLQASHYAAIAASAKLESVRCDYGPALAENQVRGGAGLFKLQAACPFAAFARLRLGARTALPHSVGFSALERGNMLHEVLAHLGEQWPSQSALLQTPEPQRKGIIATACETAVAKYRRRRPKALPHAYCLLEQQRLAQHISHWLHTEEQRPAFTVLEIEKARQIAFAGLQLNLRVDRIDQLDNGELMIIDYKTGKAKTSHWRAEALREPQLPLYACVHQDHPVGAIAFGIINAEQHSLQGWGNNPYAPGLSVQAPQDWQTQLESWHESLDELAQEFIQGYAAVDYRFADTQNFDADLHPLSRIAERRRLQQWQDDNPTSRSV